MNPDKMVIRAFLFVLCVGVIKCTIAQQTLSLQQLLNGMQSNYELLKAQGSLVQARQAEKRATYFDRLPRLNTMLQATVASNNNLEGTYYTYGIQPTITSGTRTYNDLQAASGDAAFAGINWEAVNFGEFKANEDLAKSNLLVQMNALAKTQYDLNGIASSYYLELIHQYELQNVQQDNVVRLQQLKTSIDALVVSGVRPGIDSMIASAELSKSMVQLYQAQKNFAQMKVQLSTLSSIPVSEINPDTLAGDKINTDGAAFVFTTPVDTVHHPYINLYSSMYDYSKARIKLENNSYYPRIMVDIDGWDRGSSINNNGVYNSNLAEGYEPTRFNYMFGLTMLYDIFGIAHKRINAAIYRFQSDAAYHELKNEKVNLNNDVQQALLEKDFQLNRLSETGHQLRSATAAYTQQLSLYNSGLSSIIELSTAQEFYIQAQIDYVDARVGLMRSIINYSLVTNSFGALVQTLNL
jgi:outer membrane protein TolC